MTMPTQPRIYHITHVDNLAAMAAAGGLLSDATMLQGGGPTASIGMQSVKKRRLRLPVACHPGDCVGDYVPFFFCPRSIMLYVLYRANHPELGYRGGQGPIVHLEADLRAVIDWASGQRRRWAFSLSNAGASYTEFRCKPAEFSEVKWSAVAATNFRSAEVREGKQAEFLVHGDFPWSLVERIGVSSQAVAATVRAEIRDAAHQPSVSVQPGWYF